MANPCPYNVSTGPSKGVAVGDIPAPPGKVSVQVYYGGISHSQFLTERQAEALALALTQWVRNLRARG